jgi:hypothetical protein
MHFGRKIDSHVWTQVYRHLLFNRLGRDDNQFDVGNSNQGQEALANKMVSSAQSFD